MSKIFISQFNPSIKFSKPALWFIFKQDEILLCTQSECTEIPLSSDLSALTLDHHSAHYLGTYDTTPCYALELSTIETLPANLQFYPLRAAQYLRNDENLFLIASRAKQILAWDKATQFCGHCSGKTKFSDKERAKICTQCQAIFYPHVVPVIMALIWRKDEILLARSPHFAEKIYSVLAGFVEPGETLEQTVLREVKEEVGISVKNPQYFGSQPWPFPSNLMIGFVAEYESGEIVMDPVEIEDAQWFKFDQLPMLPNPLSLAHQMITKFRKEI